MEPALTPGDEREEMGVCEVCGKSILKGDPSQHGGSDMLWVCEEHASTLQDTVEWYRDMRETGEWSDHDYHWDDEAEFLADLAKLEDDLATNGNRKMVTPA
jgi:hypothetical protein